MRYYILQEGRGIVKLKASDPPTPPGSFFNKDTGSAICSQVCGARSDPFFWSCVEVLGRETSRTGDNILTDIARSSPDENPRDIVSKRVAQSAQNLIAKLGEAVANVRQVKKRQNVKPIGRGRSLQKETSNSHQSLSDPHHVCCVPKFRVRYFCSKPTQA